MLVFWLKPCFSHLLTLSHLHPHKKMTNLVLRERERESISTRIRHFHATISISNLIYMKRVMIIKYYDTLENLISINIETGKRTGDAHLTYLSVIY